MTDFLDTFAELNAAFGEADGVVVLPIDQVAEDPHQPREHFDEAALEALTGSVRRKGVLQPIVVRPPGPDGRYLIRFGARRYRAARRAGLTEIRALVRAGEASEAELLIEQVIENDQRADLTTAERAKTVARLLDLGLSQADVARELDKPKDEVSMLAAVRGMPARLQALAAHLGHRTLYELHGAWRADAAGTEAWLDGRAPEAITQAEARALSSRLKGDGKAKPGTKTAASAASHAGRGASDEVAARPVATPSAGPGANGAAYAVEVARGQRVGALVLDRDPPSETEAWVRFSDGAGVQRVALADLTLLRITRPGDRPTTRKGE